VVTKRWEFGAAPLPQTVQAASLLRQVNDLMLSLEREDEAMQRLLSDLEQAATALARVAPSNPLPRVGPAVDRDGRVYLDHAFSIGKYNPCVPDYEITVEDAARAYGSVTFPISYEGPPGLVHGGFLALFFDCVVQHHNCEVGLAGKTTALNIEYRRPTPLLAPLDFTLERAVVDDRIHTSGVLQWGSKATVTIEADALAGDRTNLPAASPRRTTA
jgi:hypothetical protein